MSTLRPGSSSTCSITNSVCLATAMATGSSAVPSRPVLVAAAVSGCSRGGDLSRLAGTRVGNGNGAAGSGTRKRPLRTPLCNGLLNSYEDKSNGFVWKKDPDFPLLSFTTKERRRPEVSRSRECIRMHLGQDLSLKMHSHQIVHTKTERLELDLKRARDQSYTKTMEMSKLLTEKEELELKIQELMNKNLQLAKEKEELCKEYEEKLSRKNSLNESGQLDKLRQENESLSCKVQRFAGEKAELLRENNDLKEELYRKTAVMSKLVSEKEELRMQTEMLTFKNIQLSDEKEALCREYEERLWREKQLRKGCRAFLMERDQMDQRLSSRECKEALRVSAKQEQTLQRTRQKLMKKWWNIN